MQPDSNQTESVAFTFVADKVAEEVNESLTLQLVPTPAALTAQTIPIGEGVFYKQEINLTIIDANREFITIHLSVYRIPQDPVEYSKVASKYAYTDYRPTSCYNCYYIYSTTSACMYLNLLHACKHVLVYTYTH